MFIFEGSSYLKQIIILLTKMNGRYIIEDSSNINSELQAQGWFLRCKFLNNWTIMLPLFVSYQLFIARMNDDNSDESLSQF